MLQVKVDAKTKSLLDDYNMKKKEEKEKRREEREKEEPEEGEERGSDSEDGDADGLAEREDDIAKTGFEEILLEYSVELNKDNKQCKLFILSGTRQPLLV